MKKKEICECEHENCACGNEVKVKIEGAEWTSAKDKAFNKIIQEVKMDGFRKGKAPRNVYEKKYGKERITMEAVDVVLPVAYKKAIEEANVELVARPAVDITDLTDDYVEFVFHLVVKPTVEIKKYQGLGVKPEKVTVTKEEIAAEIEAMQKKYSEISLKDGAIATGDTAIIDFKGFKDGEPFEGGSGENYSLEIGSNTFIPGFEDALIGLNKGEEKDVKLSFPTDYPHEELKGQEVVFKVKVNEVKTKIVPELNEEFFGDLALEGVTSLKELESFVEDNIKARKEYDLENKYIDALLEALNEQTVVEIPHEMIDEEIDRMLNQFSEQLKMQGIDMNYYYQLTSSTEESLKAQMSTEAEKRVKSRLALEEVAALAKIEISEEDANAEADNLSAKYNMEKEEFLKLFGGLDMVKYDLKMRRAIEELKK